MNFWIRFAVCLALQLFSLKDQWCFQDPSLSEVRSRYLEKSASLSKVSYSVTKEGDTEMFTLM